MRSITPMKIPPSDRRVVADTASVLGGLLAREPDVKFARPRSSGNDQGREPAYPHACQSETVGTDRRGDRRTDYSAGLARGEKEGVGLGACQPCLTCDVHGYHAAATVQVARTRAKPGIE